MRVVSVPSDTFTYNAHVAFPSSYASPVQYASDIIATGTTSAIAIMHDSTNFVVYQITISGTTPTVVQGSKTASLVLSAAALAATRSMSTALSPDGNFIYCMIRITGSAGILLVGVTTQTSVNPNHVGQFISLYNYFSETPAGTSSLWASGGVLGFGDTLAMPSRDLLYFGYASQAGIIHTYALAPLAVGMITNTNTTVNRVGGANISGYFSTLTTPRTITIVDNNTPVGSAHSVGSIDSLDINTSIGIFITDDGTTTSIMAVPIERHQVLGICREGGVGDGTVKGRVQVAGIVSGLTGLISGQKYFVDDAGNLSLETNNWEMGTALSASELILEKRELL